MTAETAEQKIRSFIAIPLAPELKKGLLRLQLRLRSEFPALKPVLPDNLHLTLHFLGDRKQDELAEIGRIMLSVGEKKKIFNVNLEGLGVFPGSRRPRVLWVGLSPPEGVIELHTRLNEEMALAGLPTDQRPFRPHLTLGRFKDPRQKGISLGHFLTQSYGILRVDSMVLYRSNLTAGGAIHTPLVTAGLAPGEG